MVDDKQKEKETTGKIRMSEATAEFYQQTCVLVQPLRLFTSKLLSYLSLGSGLVLFLRVPRQGLLRQMHDKDKLSI